MNSTILYIVLIIVLIINFIIFTKYNQLITALNKVKKAQGSIDIYSNKRFDLIPNLVECVKGYSKHESDTLEKIVKLRTDYQKNDNKNIKQVEKMNNELNKYLAIVESYPELKADSQFMNLQKELSVIKLSV